MQKVKVTVSCQKQRLKNAFHEILKQPYAAFIIVKIAFLFLLLFTCHLFSKILFLCIPTEHEQCIYPYFVAFWTSH